MRTDLTQDQIDFYRENGYIHIPGLLDAAEVAELKEAVVSSAASMTVKLAGAPETERWSVHNKNDYYSQVFTQRINLHRLSEVVKRYMLDAEIGRMMCDLEGVDGFRVWHDQTLIKEPYGNPTAWHLDNPYWSFSSPHATSIWIALEDATLGNGCMWFVPGSHKLTNWDTVVGIGQSQGELFKAFPQLREIDPVAVPMKAGDCSFHNGMTAHGAGANMTRRRRIAMTCAYMPDGSVFNGKRNILPEAYFNSLKLGDVLNSDEQNPLVYRRQAVESRG